MTAQKLLVLVVIGGVPLWGVIQLVMMMIAPQLLHLSLPQFLPRLVLRLLVFTVIWQLMRKVTGTKPLPTDDEIMAAAARK